VARGWRGGGGRGYGGWQGGWERAVEWERAGEWQEEETWRVAGEEGAMGVAGRERWGGGGGGGGVVDIAYL